MPPTLNDVAWTVLDSVTAPVTASVWATVMAPSTAVVLPDFPRLIGPSPIVTVAVVVARIYERVHHICACVCVSV